MIRRGQSGFVAADAPQAAEGHVEPDGPSSEAPLDVLVRGVAHAINNPLAAIVANLSLMDELLADGDAADMPSRAAKVRQLLAETRQASERLGEVAARLHAPRASDEARRLLSEEPKFGVAEAPSAPGVKTARVLIVDDDPLVARAVRRCLRDYDVVAEDDGRGALERVARGERFHVIVCDLMMPGMTGMDLYASLVQSVPEQADAMIFLTGGAVTTRAQDFVAAVSNVVMEKPFDVPRLRELVRSRIASHPMK